MEQYLKLIRVHHWVKNFLVFLPLVFSGNVLQANRLIAATLAFFSFSCLASAIYIINDINDVENDRAHPTKKYRPLASGAVSMTRAATLSILLIILSFVLQALTFHPTGFIWPILYLALNVAYSKFRFKEIPIVDVIILASGYIIRVLYGGVVADIEVSAWLYLTVLAGSFYLGLGKRRGEYRQAQDGTTTRAVLTKYSDAFLDKMMYLFLALANTLYALWARDAAYGMLITVPILWAISMKYSLTIEGGSDGDPIETILADKTLQVLALLLIVTILLSLYVEIPYFV